MEANKGFTLIEVLVSVAVITLIISIPMSIITSYLVENSLTKKVVQGRFKAQEGLEYIRHIRDSNFISLQSPHWLSGLEDTGTDADLIINNRDGTIDCTSVVDNLNCCLVLPENPNGEYCLFNEDSEGFLSGFTRTNYFSSNVDENACDRGGFSEVNLDKFVRTFTLEPDTYENAELLKVTVCVSWFEINSSGNVKTNRVEITEFINKWLEKEI